MNKLSETDAAWAELELLVATEMTPIVDVLIETTCAGHVITQNSIDEFALRQQRQTEMYWEQRRLREGVERSGGNNSVVVEASGGNNRPIGSSGGNNSVVVEASGGNNSSIGSSGGNNSVETGADRTCPILSLGGNNSSIESSGGNNSVERGADRTCPILSLGGNNSSIDQVVVTLLKKCQLSSLTFLLHQFIHILSDRQTHSKSDVHVYVASKKWKQVFGKAYKNVISLFFTLNEAIGVRSGVSAAYSYNKDVLLSACEGILDILEAKPPTQLTAALNKKKVSDFTLPGIKTADIGNCDVILRAQKLILDNTHISNYRHSDAAKDRTYKGRLFATGISLQNTSKINKRILLKDTQFVDADIASCFPTLLLADADKYGIAAPLLRKYVAKSKAFRALYAEDVFNLKNAVNNIIGGMGWLKILTDSGANKTSASFRDGFLHPLFSEIRSIVKRTAEEEVFIGHTHQLNTLRLQTLENDYLMKMNGWLNDNDKKTVALMFDGLICENLSETQVKAMEEYSNAATGLQMKLVIKEVF